MFQSHAAKLHYWGGGEQGSRFFKLVLAGYSDYKWKSFKDVFINHVGLSKINSSYSLVSILLSK